MKSLSAMMRFSPDCPLTKHDFTKQESDENNSPDIKSMKHDNDSSSSSSSSNYSSSSSSSNSPPPHPVLPPPLLPLAAFPDHPPPLLPLLSFVPGRLSHPMGSGTSFLTFPQPSNGASFMPFHHPASVFLRQQQAALAYSYAIIHHQHQQQMLQQKQLNENRSTIFRPHELSDHHRHQHGLNSSAELSYYLHKIVPHDYNDAVLLNRGKMYRPNTPVLTDQSPIDLRKISSIGDDSTRYNNNNNHHQQQFVHATPKKNPTSGKKLIGIRFLFPPFADHVTLYERAKIWVARHEYKYFVDWSSDDLLKVDLDLRPIQPITRQQYKIHMNRSEFCRNVKLKFCLQTDSPWAKDFCEKLQKSPAEGGFTGLCQAKIAAADLWRTYSENYRSHQARQPNGTSLKTFANPKTTPTKKRSLVADENTIKKCAKMDSLAVLSDKFVSKQIDEQDSESIMDQSKLRNNNNYYYYYYHQHHNDLKFQVNKDFVGERKVTNHEMSLRDSSPGLCQDQSNRSKMSDNEDDGNDVKTNKSSSRESKLQKPTIWKPFLKTKFNDDDRKQLPVVGDAEKYFEAKNQNVDVKGRCEIVENISNGDENRKMEVDTSEPKNSMEKIINRSDHNQQPRSFTNPYKSFSSRILQKFGNQFFDLRSAEDFQNSTNQNRSNVNNNKKNFTLEYKQLKNKCDVDDDDDDDDVRHATNLDEIWSSIKHNQSKEHWDKFIQSDKVATSSSFSNNPESTNQDEEGSSKEGRSFKLFLLDKSRSVPHREPMNSFRIEADQPKKDSMGHRGFVNGRLSHHPSPNESSNHHVSSSRIIDQSDESDDEVNVVDADENYK